MGSRLDLQSLLEVITEKVHFQPPTNIQMQYPCILYERDNTWSEYADNRPYANAKRYQVTVIDRDPDTTLPDEVESLQYCSFVRAFETEGLHHYVFNLFF